MRAKRRAVQGGAAASGAADHVEEVLMDGRVAGQFGVKRGDELVPLAGRGDAAVHHGKRPGFAGGFCDERRADEGHGDDAGAVESGVGGEAAELAAVGVPHGGDVHGGEVGAGIVADGPGEEQEARAGAEDGEPRGDALFQRFVQPQPAEEPALYGAFASGEDQPVEGLVQVAALPDLHDGDAQARQHLLVLDECALQGEYGDAHDH